MREGVKVREEASKFVEHQGEAGGEEQGTEQKREAQAEQKAHSAVALFGSDGCGKRAKGSSLLAQGAAEDIQVSAKPEANLAPGLPKQIHARAHNQKANDSQKLRHCRSASAAGRARENRPALGHLERRIYFNGRCTVSSFRSG